MRSFTNVHQQFAEFFKSDTLRPFAFLVSKKLSEGHICINLKEVSKELEGFSVYDKEAAVNDLFTLKDEPLVTVEGGVKQPFVLHNDRLYLQRYFHYETSILQRIRLFINSDPGMVKNKMQELTKHATMISDIFDSADSSDSSSQEENIDWQFVAVISAVLNKFTIITGGPGTGKTTTVAKILALLYTINPQLKVALAAPTGKAAVRMAESLKNSALQTISHLGEKIQSITPGTIHRLLKYIPDSPYFKHNKENPVNYDVVIVDESSMIDVALFAKLLDAIGVGTKLILLGDKDQLASVEAGSLFGDLCKSQGGNYFVSPEKAGLINALMKDSHRTIPARFMVRTNTYSLAAHIIELKKSHRFTSEIGIGKFSKAIIKNDVQTLQVYLENKGDDQVTLDTNYDSNIFEQFAAGYADYIKEADIKTALQKINKLRILCAVREGEQGLYSLNLAIENYLRKKKLINKNSEYYENRPIIVTRNYYSLGLYNGDVGIIRADENGLLKAWFEDSDNGLRSVLPGYIAGSETVFAMTIHKSQGSEYDQVLVVLPDNTNIQILTRELLYTAVTRARYKVIVQASEAVILHTAKGLVERASGIMERFAEE